MRIEQMWGRRLIFRGIARRGGFEWVATFETEQGRIDLNRIELDAVVLKLGFAGKGNVQVDIANRVLDMYYRNERLEATEIFGLFADEIAILQNLAMEDLK